VREKWIQLRLTCSNKGLGRKDGSAIDPAALPISDDLRERLEAWCARLWDTLGDETITGIARTPAGREQAWALIDTLDKEGFAIARALKAELPDWTVYYYDAATVAASHFEQPAAEFGVLIESP
jgi:hypothetical protein